MVKNVNIMPEKVDVVFPEGNEDELLTLSKELGFKQIILCYKPLDSKKLKEIEQYRTKAKIGVLVMTQRDIDRNKKHADYLIGVANRMMFENKNVHFIINAELAEKKDSMHYRRSGITQVESKIAKDKRKTVLMNFKNILDSDNPSIILGRMLQNAMILEKYNTEWFVVSGASSWNYMRSRKDLESFAEFLKETAQRMKR